MVGPTARKVGTAELSAIPRLTLSVFVYRQPIVSVRSALLTKTARAANVMSSTANKFAVSIVKLMMNAQTITPAQNALGTECVFRKMVHAPVIKNQAATLDFAKRETRSARVTDVKRVTLKWAGSDVMQRNRQPSSVMVSMTIATDSQMIFLAWENPVNEKQTSVTIPSLAWGASSAQLNH